MPSKGNEMKKIKRTKMGERMDGRKEGEKKIKKK